MTISIIPREYQNLYGALLKKEQQLRPRGAFYRVPGRYKRYTKWRHKRYKGWVWLSKSMSDVVVVEIETRDVANAWQILSGFVGFLDRYFKEQISSINIHYVHED